MSGRVEEEVVKDWGHFVEIVDKYGMGSPHQPMFLFRGQANSDWSLIPSLIRMAKRFDLKPEHISTLEDQLLQDFKKQAHLHFPPATIPKPGDFLSWWTLMQHHHAPTRLLDWTYSPFVALYFACVQLEQREGAVWMVASRYISEQMVKKFPDCAGDATRERQLQCYRSPSGPDFLDFIERNTQTAQMVAQQTMHSVSTAPLADHGALVESVLTGKESRQGNPFRKLIIPERKKVEFLRRLRFMNVTSNALFPGIDGLGRSIAELAVLNCGQIKTQIVAKAIYGD